MKMIDEQTRPVRASDKDEVQEHVTGHCHDGEKCNADTFCGCPCRICMRTARGEYSHR